MRLTSIRELPDDLQDRLADTIRRLHWTVEWHLTCRYYTLNHQNAHMRMRHAGPRSMG